MRLPVLDGDDFRVDEAATKEMVTLVMRDLIRNGWEIQHSREMQARIAIVYVECVRDASRR